MQDKVIVYVKGYIVIIYGRLFNYYLLLIMFSVIAFIYMYYCEYINHYDVPSSIQSRITGPPITGGL